jgi:hypothetical protein
MGQLELWTKPSNLKSRLKLVSFYFFDNWSQLQVIHSEYPFVTMSEMTKVIWYKMKWTDIYSLLIFANIKQFSCLIPSASVLSIIQKNWRLTPNKFPFDENKFFTWALFSQMANLDNLQVTTLSNNFLTVWCFLSIP